MVSGEAQIDEMAYTTANGGILGIQAIAVKPLDQLGACGVQVFGAEGVPIVSTVCGSELWINKRTGEAE